MGLTFDDATHTYLLDGEVIPSVTQVMKPLTEAYYNNVDTKILNMAANRGHIVHSAIETLLKDDIDDIPPEYSGYFNAFKRFMDDYPFDVVGIEMRTHHQILRYAGTVDLLCKIGNELILVDYKTTAKINDMLTGVQLEAYAAALASNDSHVDNKAILHLHNDGRYKLKWYGKHNSENIAVFGACLKIYNHLQKYKEE